MPIKLMRRSLARMEMRSGRDVLIPAVPFFIFTRDERRKTGYPILKSQLFTVYCSTDFT
jgi:hypothetical protein